MTIIEAISGANKLKENQIEQNIKISWLSELDGRIYQEIMDSDGKENCFSGYEESVNQGTTLLIPPPYDSLYKYWLVWQMECMLKEEDRANNTYKLFRETYDEFLKRYLRTHRTPRVKIRLWG